MPLICLQLKTIYQRMTSFLPSQTGVGSLFLSAVLYAGYPQTAQAFDWPFSTEEFKSQLSARELTASTRYYARGPSYLTGQKWNPTLFRQHLTNQNYRLRESDQILMAGDAKELRLPNCKYLTRIEELTEGFTCWMWKTQGGDTYLTVIDTAQIIHSTWSGDTPARHWKASLDPVLVAQYRGEQPIMQNELKISDFPVNCLNAVMAIEDSEFLEHSGVSYIGLTRSLIKNISKMRYAQGGSTITQQLVKNYFLTPEKTISRKLKELYLAIKLESEWTKDQILETYLNIIYMGQSGAFQVLGFGAASRYYFNKPVQQLDLSECALMAAIVNNPGVYNPWKKNEKATARRKLVLDKMLELNLVTAHEHSEALKLGMPTRVPPPAAETAPYFLEAVRKQLATLIAPEKTSVSVYTSLDLNAQQAAQTAIQKHIAELEKTRKHLSKNREQGHRLEGLVLSGENQTGLVNVLVGGQNYRQTQFNRALNGKRQIGSLVKPFIYLTALQNGADPLTPVADEKFVWKYDRRSWSPQNYDKKFHGTVPLYYALKESLNSAAARTAHDAGIKSIVETARQLGMTSDMALTPATSLGASVHYPLEILDSYRTMANSGQFSTSGFIEKITDADGGTLYQFTPGFEHRFDSGLIAVLIGMMKETLRSGSAKVSSALGWTSPSAGKTGTSSDNKDAWFAGFTPFQTTVVWLGYDQGLSSRLTGGSGAVPVWVDLMKSYSAVWPDHDFQWPPDTEVREVSLYGSTQKTELVFRK